MAMPGERRAVAWVSTLSKQRTTTPTAITASPRGPITRIRSSEPTGRVSLVAANRPPRLTSTVRAMKLPRMSDTDSLHLDGIAAGGAAVAGIRLGHGGDPYEFGPT